jgi:hypothetical protein
MKPFESFGVFWRASKSEEEALSGRLVFDPQDGAHLELVGHFDTGTRWPFEENGDVEPVTLYGWLGNKKVTLVNCYDGKWKYSFAGVSESSFMVNGIFRGAHLPDSNLRFDTAHIRTTGGVDWVGEAVVSAESRSESPSPAKWLNYSEPQRQVATFSRGELAMGYSWRTSGSGSKGRVEFEHWPTFSVRYSESTSFDVIRSDLGRIEDLVTLCADQVTSLDQLSIQRSDILVEMPSGAGEKTYEQEIEYIAPAVDVKAWKTRHSQEMLLTYAEVGGISGIGRWLDAVPKFARSLDSLMSVKRAGRIYGENRFLNVAFAAEALHRDLRGGLDLPAEEFDKVRSRCLAAVGDSHSAWLDQRLRYANEMTLRNRLRALFEQSGEHALPFVDHPNRWVSVIAGVRNALTHLDSRRSGFDGGDLYYLSESLYALARACMLMELGVSGARIAEKSNSQPFSWYSNRLNGAVERLRRDL